VVERVGSRRGSVRTVLHRGDRPAQFAVSPGWTRLTAFM
jgi:hypothetical protein